MRQRTCLALLSFAVFCTVSCGREPVPTAGAASPVDPAPEKPTGPDQPPPAPPDAKPDTREPAKPIPAGIEQVTAQLASELLLDGYFKKSLSESGIEIAARQPDWPLARKLAWCYIAQYPKPIEDRPGFQELVKAKAEAELLTTDARVKVDGYVRSYVESRVRDLEARRKIVTFQKNLDAVEVRMNAQLTAEQAAELLWLEAAVKTATTKEHESSRKALTDAVRQAIQAIPGAEKALLAAQEYEAKEATEDLRTSRRRVRGLIDGKAAQNRIGAIQYVAETYRLKHNKFPPSLKALVDGKLIAAESVIDPWNQPIEYDPAGKRNGGKRPDIWTVTPDKVTLGNWPDEKK